jgi:hypothetical protein
MKFGKWLLIFVLVFGALAFCRAAAPEVRFAQAVVGPVASRGQHRADRHQSLRPVGAGQWLVDQGRGGKEVAGFDELFINVSAASIFKLAAVIDEIRLQGLRVAVARVAEGRYDISDLLDEWMKPKDEPRANAALLAEQYPVDQRQDRFRRSAQGQAYTISDINLTLPFVSSLPYQADGINRPSTAPLWP